MSRYVSVFFFLLLTAGLIVCVPHLQAEMKITLKDGKIIEVPVSEDEVKSIEYGDAQKTAEVLPEKAIRMQSAKYGNISFELEGELGYKHYFCNAKDALVKKCDGKNNCRIIVGNSFCGDPYPGKGKYLYVEYTCGQKLKRAKKSQTEVMVLKCP
ncbi:hypothetical protein [Desulfovibrio sp. JC010]|uniref:hypothetical protein n=1 Tax=Desulfovibrio sp. JC010 TaxID=2593641 RepID=UPI0013D407C6|nr:hypothetical protein [Desulfovibrio sp. JC010]NDV27894.1 hypothetical protein [Desulfovibrio sp. JC010]